MCNVALPENSIVRASLSVMDLWAGNPWRFTDWRGVGRRWQTTGCTVYRVYAVLVRKPHYILRSGLSASASTSLAVSRSITFTGLFNSTNNNTLFLNCHRSSAGKSSDPPPPRVCQSDNHSDVLKSESIAAAWASRACVTFFSLFLSLCLSSSLQSGIERVADPGCIERDSILLSRAFFPMRSG